MSKNTVKRTQATVQRADTIGTLNEEHIVIDNSLMPSAEELAKYKEIDPDLVRYFQRITDEERNLRHEATRQSLELLAIDNERRHRERMRGQILAFPLIFLGDHSFGSLSGAVLARRSFQYALYRRDRISIH